MGAYNATTGSASVGTSTASVKAVIEQYTEAERGGLVEEGDLKVTVAQKGITEPKQDDTVTIDSVAYQIVQVEHVDSGTDPVLYTMQVRR